MMILLNKKREIDRTVSLKGFILINNSTRNILLYTEA